MPGHTAVPFAKVVIPSLQPAARFMSVSETFRDKEEREPGVQLFTRPLAGVLLRSSLGVPTSST